MLAAFEGLIRAWGLAVGSRVWKPLPSPTQPCECSSHPHGAAALDRQKSGSQEAGLDRGTAVSCGETFSGPQSESVLRPSQGSDPRGGPSLGSPDVCSCSWDHPMRWRLPSPRETCGAEERRYFLSRIYVCVRVCACVCVCV